MYVDIASQLIVEPSFSSLADCLNSIIRLLNASSPDVFSGTAMNSEKRITLPMS
jgi:hypothetical protein